LCTSRRGQHGFSLKLLKYCDNHTTIYFCWHKRQFLKPGRYITSHNSLFYLREAA